MLSPRGAVAPPPPPSFFAAAQNDRGLILPPRAGLPVGRRSEGSGAERPRRSNPIPPQIPRCARNDKRLRLGMTGESVVIAPGQRRVSVYVDLDLGAGGHRRRARPAAAPT